MNKYSAFLPALALLGACQSQPATDTAATQAAGEAAPVHLASLKTNTAPPTTLTAADLQFLRQHDLAPLLRLSADNPHARNGAYGADHYRIEFVFTSVERDAARPYVFHVRGKNRYKQTITPFAGDVTLEKLKRSFEGKDAYYAATGRFELKEQGTSSVGTFRGKTAIDFAIDNAQPTLTPYASHPVARGGGLLFEGQWTSARTGAQKPVVWAEEFMPIGSEILQNFVVGERDASINPKYARLGWDNYWENDEWWADSGKTVSL